MKRPLKPIKPTRTWNTETVAYLIKRRQELASAGTIAKELTAMTKHSFSLSAVTGKIAKMVKDGMPLRIPKKVATPKAPRQHVRPIWQEPELVILRQGYREGWHNKVIAEKTGRPVAGVVNRARKEGLLKGVILARPVRRPTPAVIPPDPNRNQDTNNKLISGIESARLRRDYVPVVGQGGMLFSDAVERSLCRWVLGDVDGNRTRCCGGKALMGRPYCVEHMAVSYPRMAERVSGERNAERI